MWVRAEAAALKVLGVGSGCGFESAGRGTHKYEDGRLWDTECESVIDRTIVPLRRTQSRPTRGRHRCCRVRRRNLLGDAGSLQLVLHACMVHTFASSHVVRTGAWHALLSAGLGMPGHRLAFGQRCGCRLAAE
eukprot:279878-Chlamydomonas_euryale.AAC.1